MQMGYEAAPSPPQIKVLCFFFFTRGVIGSVFQGAPGLQQNGDTTGCGGLEAAPKKLWIFDLFFLGGGE